MASNGTRKRKAPPPERIIKDLVPKDTPWTKSDWWNEQSGTCRPIIEAICQNLSSAAEILMIEEQQVEESAPAEAQQEEDDERSNSGRSHVVTPRRTRAAANKKPSPTSVLDFEVVDDAVVSAEEEEEDGNENEKQQQQQSRQDDRKLPAVPEMASFTRNIMFDRGSVKYLDDQIVPGAHVWAVFHPDWGRMLGGGCDRPEAPKTRNTAKKRKGGAANGPNQWRIVGRDPQSMSRKSRTHAIYKPHGLISNELTSCVATLRYHKKHQKDTHDQKDDLSGAPPSVLPAEEAAHHVKVAEFQWMCLKAREALATRKTAKVPALKVKLHCTGKQVDLMPIVRVIVDDERGEIFVVDVTDVLDAMIGYAATRKSAFGKNNTDANGEDATHWTAEHATCGDLDRLCDGWERANRETVASFVALCLDDALPNSDGKSERSAALESISTLGRRRRPRSRRMLPTKRHKKTIEAAVADETTATAQTSTTDDHLATQPEITEWV